MKSKLNQNVQIDKKGPKLTEEVQTRLMIPSIDQPKTLVFPPANLKHVPQGLGQLKLHRLPAVMKDPREKLPNLPQYLLPFFSFICLDTFMKGKWWEGEQGIFTPIPPPTLRLKHIYTHKCASRVFKSNKKLYFHDNTKKRLRIHLVSDLEQCT